MTEPISSETLGLPEKPTSALLENAWNELSSSKTTATLRQHSNELQGVATQLLNAHLVLRREIGGQFRVGNTNIQVTQEGEGASGKLKARKWNDVDEDSVFTWANDQKELTIETKGQEDVSLKATLRDGRLIQLDRRDREETKSLDLSSIPWNHPEEPSL